MATRWVMVRLRAETREALAQAKKRFLAGYEQGQRDAEIDCRNEEPSLDWTIRQLLAQLDRQKAREARAAAKRRKTGTVPVPPIAQ